MPFCRDRSCVYWHARAGQIGLVRHANPVLPELVRLLESRGKRLENTGLARRLAVGWRAARKFDRRASQAISFFLEEIRHPSHSFRADRAADWPVSHRTVPSGKLHGNREWRTQELQRRRTQA